VALPRARGRHTACHACTRQARSAGPCPCSIASAGARLCHMTRNRHKVALGLTPWSEPLHTFGSIRACPPTPQCPMSASERKPAPTAPARARFTLPGPAGPLTGPRCPHRHRTRPGRGGRGPAAARRGRQPAARSSGWSPCAAGAARSSPRSRSTSAPAAAAPGGAGSAHTSSPTRAARARAHPRRQRRRITPPVSYLWHVSQSCSGSAHCSTDLRDARPLLHRCHMALMERAGAQECLPPRADFT